MNPNPLSTHVDPAFCAHPRGCTCWYERGGVAQCNAGIIDPMDSPTRGHCVWSPAELDNISRGLGVQWRANSANKQRRAA